MRVQAITKENGRTTIKRIPIFKLGNIRGFMYDAAWAERAKQRMQELAQGEYYPPIIIGHNGIGSELQEKEALGFMKNFDYVLDQGNSADDPRGTIYADLDDLSDYGVYVLKEKKYPSRSVEVKNEQAEFSAIALLGGTAPHFKFPQLELFKQMSGGEVFSCPDEIIEFDDQEQVKTIINKIADGIRAMFGSAPADQPPKPNKNTAQEADMTDAEFKAKYGMTPDEMAARLKDSDGQFKAKYGMTPDEMNTKLSERDAQIKQMAQAAETAAMTQFKADLVAYGVSKAEQDTMVQTVESYSGDKQALIRQFSDLAKKASEGKLIVPMGEQGMSPGTKTTIDFDDDNSVHAAVKAYQAEKGCTFAEAKKHVFSLCKEAK